jgi:ribosomal protein L33
MAHQKTKILLISVETNEATGKKVVHTYSTTKSKGKGKPQQGKIELKKYNPILRKHVVYKQTKHK